MTFAIADIAVVWCSHHFQIVTKLGFPCLFFWTGTLHLINLKGVQRYSSRILSHKTFREGNGICRVVFMGFGIFWESYGQLAKHAWYETHNGCLESICFHPQGQKISVPKAGERLERRSVTLESITVYTMKTLQFLKIEITKTDFGSTVQRQNLLFFVVFFRHESFLWLICCSGDH